MAMEPTKKAITQVVKDYIRLYPEEFDLFKQGMGILRHTTRDSFATLEGTQYSRALYEMPETLASMLLARLDESDMIWLKAGGKEGKAGGLWFARTFPDFRIPEKI